MAFSIPNVDDYVVEGKKKWLISITYRGETGERWLNKDHDGHMPFERRHQHDRCLYPLRDNALYAMRRLCEVQMQDLNPSGLTGVILCKVKLLGYFGTPNGKSITLNFKGPVTLKLYKAMMDDDGDIEVLEYDGVEMTMDWEFPDPEFNIAS
jgi:hypothetical protein